MGGAPRYCGFPAPRGRGPWLDGALLGLPFGFVSLADAAGTLLLAEGTARPDAAADAVALAAVALAAGALADSEGEIDGAGAVAGGVVAFARKRVNHPARCAATTPPRRPTPTRKLTMNTVVGEIEGRGGARLEPAWVALELASVVTRAGDSTEEEGKLDGSVAATRGNAARSIGCVAPGPIGPTRCCSLPASCVCILRRGPMASSIVARESGTVSVLMGKARPRRAERTSSDCACQGGHSPAHSESSIGRMGGS